jgi:hypothetical protein
VLRADIFYFVIFGGHLSSTSPQRFILKFLQVLLAFGLRKLYRPPVAMGACDPFSSDCSGRAVGFGIGLEVPQQREGGGGGDRWWWRPGAAD